MSKPVLSHDQALKKTILALLDESRVMSLATLRPDGWPQVTTVGYVHDDLVLYFVVALTSQKFLNIQHDPRVSVAIARDPIDRPRIRGLSMAALASQVTEKGDVVRLNKLIAARYPAYAVFAPREASTMVFRATPTVISVVDDAKGVSQPRVLQVGAEAAIAVTLAEPRTVN